MLWSMCRRLKTSGAMNDHICKKYSGNYASFTIHIPIICYLSLVSHIESPPKSWFTVRTWHNFNNFNKYKQVYVLQVPELKKIMEFHSIFKEWWGPVEVRFITQL